MFEHAEGHALQMAVGLFCCLYALRRQWRLTDGICFLLTLTGLVVSQGRGAIFGVMIAVAFMWLPELFRSSRLVFVGTLVFFWMFPFVIWPQMAQVPGVASYLRLERGLSGRDVAWEFAMQLVQERPIRGHGFLSSGELTEIAQEGPAPEWLQRRWHDVSQHVYYQGSGTGRDRGRGLRAAVHCPCAQNMYPHALPSASKQLVRSILLVTLTASLFRDYNIGGVRSTSMMVGVFLGLANLWPWVDRMGRPRPLATDFEVISSQV